MILAIDFDGTVAKHAFPEVGEDVPHAENTLKWLCEQGHDLVLFTMRSGRFLDDAVKWFADREIPLTGIQYSPDQTTWTSSNKCFAHIYIDDAALGAPLIYPKEGRPYLDWETAALSLVRLLGETDRNPIVGGGMSDE